MFKVSPRLASALLAPVLLLSIAALARAQELTSRTDEAHRVGAHVTRQQDAQQQPTPDPQSQPAPLTAGQKIKRAFRGAFLSPAPYAVAAFNAGITQLGEDNQPQKDTNDELADWGSRTARVFATGTTYRLFGNGFYPALFKQDPRYERSKSKKFGSRLGHAVSRVFVTRHDDWNLEPNYSRFAGAATSSALANVWERSTPGHDRIGADATLKRFGMTFVSGAIGNIFREFAPGLF
ncbi:MAG: hypothetical protein QOH49_2390 [Acidobacteriota bacterium]|jgi:hypothetical protein|nr:hypothetical protein [Acidobacteriota bacterium]